MAVTSIEARCRRCRKGFELIELRDQHSATCPRCGWALTHDWGDKLRADAAAADAALGLLVRSLRSMRSLPGNVAIQPHSVLRNLGDEVGWERDLADDPELLRPALREARRLLDTWELLDPAVAAAQPRRSRLQRAVDWLTGRPLPIVRRTAGVRHAPPVTPTPPAVADVADREAGRGTQPDALVARA
jgi:hypothetical protein